MPRAVRVLVPAAVLFLVLLAVLAPSRSPRAAASIIDASARVDYREAPNFQVGSWVKYRTVSKSLKGYSDDYTTTILVAGEEVLWGEPCFWLETWVDRGHGEEMSATLVSYAAFGDTMTRKHLTWFVRKYINGLDEHGQPVYDLATRASSELHMRRANWDAATEKLHVSPLPPETITLPLGTFATKKEQFRNGAASTEEMADSTVYYERVTEEVHYLTRQVPITSLAKLVITDTQRGKSWKAGQFNRDTTLVLERADGVMSLMGMGRTGLESKLLPKELRRPIADRALVARTILQPQYPPTVLLKPGQGP